jgi:F0F1-type ATP synthase epsilon subunit
MRCKIISPSQSQEFQGVTSVTLPAFLGQMEILPGHSEAFVELQEGIVLLKNSKEKSLPVSGGICHIKDDRVLILL